MRNLWWVAVLLGGCLRWDSAPDESACSAIGVIFSPIRQTRMDLQRPDFISNLGVWIRRASVDEAAEDALQLAELPEQLSAADITASVVFLRGSAALANELVDLHTAVSRLNSGQYALRARIDLTSAELTALLPRGGRDRPTVRAAAPC